MTEDDDNDPKVKMDQVRKWNWFLFGLVLVNTTEDVVDAISQGLGNLRCQMVGHVRYREDQERMLQNTLKEIERL